MPGHQRHRARVARGPRALLLRCRLFNHADPYTRPEVELQVEFYGFQVFPAHKSAYYGFREMVDPKSEAPSVRDTSVPPLLGTRAVMGGGMNQEGIGPAWTKAHEAGPIRVRWRVRCTARLCTTGTPAKRTAGSAPAPNCLAHVVDARPMFRASLDIAGSIACFVWAGDPSSARAFSSDGAIEDCMSSARSGASRTPTKSRRRATLTSTLSSTFQPMPVMRLALASTAPACCPY